MNISELRTRQGNVSIEAVVKSIEEPRAFNKFGRDLRVTNAIIEDSSGSIKLSLWNDDIEKVHAGDTVRITNGFVNEFKGENQLTTGKFGKLEVIKHGDESKSAAKEKGEETNKREPSPEGEINEDSKIEEEPAAEDSEEEYNEDY